MVGGTPIADGGPSGPDDSRSGACAGPVGGGSSPGFGLLAGLREQSGAVQSSCRRWPGGLAVLRFVANRQKKGQPLDGLAFLRYSESEPQPTQAAALGSVRENTGEFGIARRLFYYPQPVRIGTPSHVESIAHPGPLVKGFGLNCPNFRTDKEVQTGRLLYQDFGVGATQAGGLKRGYTYSSD